MSYPVTLGQQRHTGSRKHCQQLLEGHEGFLQVKGQFQPGYIPDVGQEGGVVVGVVPTEGSRPKRVSSYVSVSGISSFTRLN